MWLVPSGSVITITTKKSAAETERLARKRLARDGVVRLAAETANGYQRRVLGAVRDRLAADAALEVFGPTSDQGDGYTYVWVHPAGTQHAGVWGDPAGLVLDPDDIEVEVVGDGPWD